MNEKEEVELRAKIAYDIRAELVCCDEYDRIQALDKVMQANGESNWIPEKELKNYHAICHWGEAAARIAECKSDESTSESENNTKSGKI